MPDINQDSVLIPHLFDAQPVGVTLLKPVFSLEKGKNSSIIDFEVSYYNKAAATLMEISEQEFLNKLLVKDGFLGGECENIGFRQSLEVYINNTSKEYFCYNPTVKRHFNVVRTRINDGVLNVVRDITDQ